MARRRRINCIFCGEEGALRAIEDVLPLWLANKLAYYAELQHPGSAPQYVDYAYESLEAMGSDDDSSRAKSQRVVGKLPVGYKAPEICERCNNGWMSRLETAVRPVLVGFVEGRAKFLTPYDQLVLSTWAVKTSLTYDASREPSWVPNGVGSRRLFGLGHPLPGATVVLGNDPTHVPLGEFVHARQEILAPGRPTPVGVKFGFQFNGCGMFVTIPLADGVPVLPISRSSVNVRTIWPPANTGFMWPSTASEGAPTDHDS